MLKDELLHIVSAAEVPHFIICRGEYSVKLGQWTTYILETLTFGIGYCDCWVIYDIIFISQSFSPFFVLAQSQSVIK